MTSTATTIEHAAPPYSGPRAFVQRLRHGDEIAHLITLIFAAGILLITSMLVYELWQIPIFRAQNSAGFSFGPTLGIRSSIILALLPFIYGTLVTSVVSLALAVPLGLASAIFLSELAPRKISDAISFLIDLLAAVPSVIYGLLGIFIVVPLMRTARALLINTLGVPARKVISGPNYGVGFLTAGIVLAIMVVPFIISVSREVLLTVPREQREAALAPGRHALGSHLESRGAVGSDRNYGLDIPGSGARAGRNDGRYHGHRQRPENQRFSLRVRATRSPPSSPMNSRKRPATFT